MAQIRPFHALRPTPEKVTQVAAVPYDVVDSHEARILAEGNPLSLLHVSRPEIDLPVETDIYSDAVYEMGRSNFERIIDQAPLVSDAVPGLFVYRQIMGGHSQVGLMACAAVDDYDSDLVKKHELTRKDKEDDRTRHIVTLRAQTGPVFLTYRPDRSIDAMVASVVATKPLYDYVAPDGVSHTFWRAPESAPLVEAFAKVPVTYIADGHHRAASASRARAQLRQANPVHTGNEEYNWFLAVLFPADQLRILPYNRVVKDLNGLTPDAFRAKVKDLFGLAAGATPDPKGPGHASMYMDGQWYGLTLSAAPGKTGPTDRLDVSILQDRLLRPLLGIDNPRTDKRIDFVGGIRGTAELERRVKEGWAVAFSMVPTTLDDLMRVADAGLQMPPKSTWFEPKLRSGLAIHRI